MAFRGGKLKWVLGAMAALLAVVAYASFRRDIPLETLKVRWATGASRFVDVDGMSVHYRDEGSGPVLLLLHGNGASLHTWDGWAQALRASFRVVRMDLPGFGLTGPAPDSDYSIAASIRFVDDFAKALELPRFALGGNSLGGHIAWEYALAHPERVHALVLVDAGGYPSQGSVLVYRLASTPVVSKLLTWGDPRPLVAKTLRETYADPSRVTDALIDRYTELSLRPGNRDAFVSRAMQPRVDHSRALSKLNVPTLVIWGREDRLIPVDYAERFRRDVRDAMVLVYDELGHVPMEEGPERTAVDVRRFLEHVGAP
jgi:pimeloyl-ACP methyl ester carboxylesterase